MPALSEAGPPLELYLISYHALAWLPCSNAFSMAVFLLFGVPNSSALALLKARESSASLWSEFGAIVMDLFVRNLSTSSSYTPMTALNRFWDICCEMVRDDLVDVGELVYVVGCVVF